MIDEARFNRSTLDRMVTLRRRLKQTMGVTIHLSEPDAFEQMIRLSETSADEDVRKLGAELAPTVSQQQKATTAGKGMIEMMRERLTSNTQGEQTASQASTSNNVVKIYRGRIVQQ